MSDQYDSLGMRIERLEAANAIARLSADYCRGADLRDLELFLSVWSDDGTWRVRDDLEFVGREHIAEGIRTQWRTTTRAFHWTSNPSIEIGVDRAQGTARFDVYSETQLLDQSWLSVAGSYYDTYISTKNGWRLRSRSAVVYSQRPI